MCARSGLGKFFVFKKLSWVDLVAGKTTQHLQALFDVTGRVKPRRQFSGVPSSQSFCKAFNSNSRCFRHQVLVVQL
jgi:hypothetical protein